MAKLFSEAEYFGFFCRFVISGGCCPASPEPTGGKGHAGPRGSIRRECLVLSSGPNRPVERVVILFFC